MRSEMKFFPTLGIYKASNVTFNPRTQDALSYGWWLFCARINGKTVFNRYSYSPTTCRHQSKVRSLLESLGVEIDIELEAPKGLQNLPDALDCMRIQLARYESKEKRSRKYAHLWAEDVQRTKVGIAFLLMDEAKSKAA